MLGNSGEIHMIGVSVWENSDLSKSVTSVNWGILEPSENKTLSYFIRNDSNFKTTFTLTTTNWNPQNASNFISLSWDLHHVSFESGETSEFQFTLKVSPEIQNINSFSFDIIISA